MVSVGIQTRAEMFRTLVFPHIPSTPRITKDGTCNYSSMISGPKRIDFTDSLLLTC
jgi:hypothetical protein